MNILQHRSKLVISKGTWPKNLKDTREKIRKCKPGEKEGQVISQEKLNESIEDRGEDGERSHEVGKFEAGKTKSRSRSRSRINRDHEIEVTILNVVNVAHQLNRRISELKQKLNFV